MERQRIVFSQSKCSRLFCPCNFYGFASLGKCRGLTVRVFLVVGLWLDIVRYLLSIQVRPYVHADSWLSFSTFPRRNSPVLSWTGGRKLRSARCRNGAHALSTALRLGCLLRLFTANARRSSMPSVAIRIRPGREQAHTNANMRPHPTRGTKPASREQVHAQVSVSPPTPHHHPLIAPVTRASTVRERINHCMLLCPLKTPALSP